MYKQKPIDLRCLLTERFNDYIIISQNIKELKEFKEFKELKESNSMFRGMIKINPKNAEAYQ